MERLGPRVATLYELQAIYLEPQLKALGVSWSSFQLLSAVQGVGSNASQAEIARRLCVTAATMSEAVSQHVHLGLLERVGKDGDRRVKLLKLTPHSRELMGKVKTVIQEMEQVIIRGLAAQTVERCAATLDKAITSLETAISETK